MNGVLMGAVIMLIGICIGVGLAFMGKDDKKKRR